MKYATVVPQLIFLNRDRSNLNQYLTRFQVEQVYMDNERLKNFFEDNKLKTKLNTVQNFIAYRLPNVSTDLYMEDGKTVYEWLNSEDANTSSVIFEANVVLENQNCNWLRHQVYQNSRGLRFFGLEYLTMRAITGHLDDTSDISVNFRAYRASDQGQKLMGDQTVPYTTDDETFRQQLRDFELEKVE